MLAVSVAAGWLVAGRVLRPWRTITATTRQISEANLHQRLAVAGPDDEPQGPGRHHRRAAGPAGGRLRHPKGRPGRPAPLCTTPPTSLRGPLTRERTAIEVALADPQASTQSLRATFERVLAASKQQQRLIDALLVLARGQADWTDASGSTWPRSPTRSCWPATPSPAPPTPPRRHPGPHPGPGRPPGRAPGRQPGRQRHRPQPARRLGPDPDQHQGGAAELAVANSDRRSHLPSLDRLLRPFQRLGPDRTGHQQATAWACPSWPPSPPPTTPATRSLPAPTAASRSWSTSPPPTAPHHQVRGTPGAGARPGPSAAPAG